MLKLASYTPNPRPAAGHTYLPFVAVVGLIVIGLTVFVLVGLWGLQQKQEMRHGQATTIEGFDDIVREADDPQNYRW